MRQGAAWILVALAPIDAALLMRVKPDAVTATDRAWRLASLMPKEVPSSATLEIEDDEGIRTVLVRQDQDAHGAEPRLLLAEKGETRVVLAIPGSAIARHAPSEGGAKHAERRRAVRAVRARSRGDVAAAVSVPGDMHHVIIPALSIAPPRTS